MEHITNKFISMRAKMQSGRPLYGWYVTFQIPDIVELIGRYWDWIWIDLQHSPIDIGAALAIVRAAECAGIHSMVRVGRNDPFLIAQGLDLGASGVIVPMINTASEALAVVQAAKFPPMGKRSYGSRRLVGLYGLDYADTANEDTVIIVQLESAQAFANVEDIAKVDGIDGLMFSPDDYVREKGLNVVIPRPPDLGAQEKRAIVEAAKRHGKIAGCFCDNPAALAASLKSGYRLIVAAEEDVVLLHGTASAKEWIDEVTRKLQADT